MGHREGARRALTTYDILSGLAVMGAATAIGSGYLVFHGHGHSPMAVKVLVISAAVTYVLLRLRGVAGRRMKYHFDHVNMTNLIANWGEMKSRKRRERAARIIGRH